MITRKARNDRRTPAKTRTRSKPVHDATEVRRARPESALNRAWQSSPPEGRRAHLRALLADPAYRPYLEELAREAGWLPGDDL